MKVIYRPKDELEPTVVGVLHVEKSLCEVLGFGEPDSRILVHLGEQTAESETDDMGVFQQYFPEPHQEVVLTLNRISQKEQVPSTPREYRQGVQESQLPAFDARLIWISPNRSPSYTFMLIFPKVLHCMDGLKTRKLPALNLRRIYSACGSFRTGRRPLFQLETLRG
jgi:hypothetical protein